MYERNYKLSIKVIIIIILFFSIQVFLTEEQEDVEDYLNSIGADYEWEKDGSLTFGYKRPACIQYPLTGTALGCPQMPTVSYLNQLLK